MKLSLVIIASLAAFTTALPTLRHRNSNPNLERTRAVHVTPTVTQRITIVHSSQSSTTTGVTKSTKSTEQVPSHSNTNEPAFYTETQTLLKPTGGQLISVVHTTIIERTKSHHPFHSKPEETEAAGSLIPTFVVSSTNPSAAAESTAVKSKGLISVTLNPSITGTAAEETESQTEFEGKNGSKSPTTTVVDTATLTNSITLVNSGAATSTPSVAAESTAVESSGSARVQRRHHPRLLPFVPPLRTIVLLIQANKEKYAVEGKKWCQAIHTVATVRIPPPTTTANTQGIASKKGGTTASTQAPCQPGQTFVPNPGYTGPARASEGFDGFCLNVDTAKAQGEKALSSSAFSVISTSTMAIRSTIRDSTDAPKPTESKRGHHHHYQPPHRSLSQTPSYGRYWQPWKSRSGSVSVTTTSTAPAGILVVATITSQTTTQISTAVVQTFTASLKLPALISISTLTQKISSVSTATALSTTTQLSYQPTTLTQQKVIVQTQVISQVVSIPGPTTTILQTVQRTILQTVSTAIFRVIPTIIHQTVPTIIHQTVPTIIHQTVPTIIHQTVPTTIHQTITSTPAATSSPNTTTTMTSTSTG